MADALDVARQFFDAVNRADVDEVMSFYDRGCVADRVFVGDDHSRVGFEHVRAAWEAELVRYAGAGPVGRRFEVTRVSGLETGWGYARVDWRSALRDAEGQPRYRSGYSHFWIDHGKIHRHSSVVLEDRPTDAPADPGGSARSSHSREYPSKPVIGIGAVILTDQRDVVLVKRRYEPLAGQWSLPGGTLELGETLEGGTAREVLEETGLVVDVGPVVEVFDRILTDETGRVRFHYVLVDYLCRPREGRLQAGTDVSDVALVPVAEIAPYRVTEKALAVIEKAVQMVTRETP